MQEKALDEKSRLILYKMLNNGTLDTISGIVSTGKEAVVIHAKGGQYVLYIFYCCGESFRIEIKDHRLKILYLLNSNLVWLL